MNRRVVDPAVVEQRQRSPSNVDKEVQPCRCSPVPAPPSLPRNGGPHCPHDELVTISSRLQFFLIHILLVLYMGSILMNALFAAGWEGCDII